jgi:hypothetical protein
VLWQFRWLTQKEKKRVLTCVLKKKYGTKATRTVHVTPVLIKVLEKGEGKVKKESEVPQYYLIS